MKTSLRLLLVASLLCPWLAKADPIQNGSFESGLTGWTVSDPTTVVLGDADGSATFLAVDSNGDFINAEDGNDYLAFTGAGPTSDSISQSFVDTAGADYTLSFWVNTDDAPSIPPLAFAASWNGAAPLTTISNPLGQQGQPAGWVEYFDPVTGTGSDTLTFSGYDTNGAVLLDNVQLQAAAGVSDGGPGLLLVAGAFLALLITAQQRAANGQQRCGC